MRSIVTAISVMAIAGMALSPMGRSGTDGFIGSDACISCHQFNNGDLITNYQNSGHPYKLNEVNGAIPTYPAHTTPGPVTPPGTEWTDFSYVIGGYGWKARFIRPDGRIYTVGDSAQYNLANSSWVAYNKGKDKKYNYACFKCHTTGGSEEGSWTGIMADSMGTFTEPGIRCEGCHGPGEDHAAAPTQVKPPYVDDALKIDRCGDCHQRGGITNAIPAKGGYIRHHEQLNEMRASAHGDGQNFDLTCASCHDAHVPLRYPDVAIDGTKAITTECQDCHTDKEILLDGVAKANVVCNDCHMPAASKSALGFTMGNGYQGDVKTHIMGINTTNAPRDSMFVDGLVKLDANGHGAVTLDFVCLQCHTAETLDWAASYAADIHTNGLVTAVGDEPAIPAEFALDQNYPNPFNPQTTVGFALPRAEHVLLTVYSIDGRQVATVLDQNMPAGQHSVTITAEVLTTGVYLYQLQAGDFTATRTMVFMK